MGNCVPVQKSTDPAMKFNPQANGVSIESPIKGNRDDMFFDSQAWLDSDCEDFLSINGDFTPSIASTPVHQSSFKETPPHEKSFGITATANSTPEPAPPDMKKQLIELFRESFGSNRPFEDGRNLRDKTETKPITLFLHSRSTTNRRSPLESVCSSEATPNIGSNYARKQKAASNYVHCCLPNLVRSLSTNERKKRLSPVYNVVGQ